MCRRLAILSNKLFHDVGTNCRLLTNIPVVAANSGTILDELRSGKFGAHTSTNLASWKYWQMVTNRCIPMGRRIILWKLYILIPTSAHNSERIIKFNGHKDDFRKCWRFFAGMPIVAATVVATNSGTILDELRSGKFGD